MQLTYNMISSGSPHDAIHGRVAAATGYGSTLQPAGLQAPPPMIYPTLTPVHSQAPPTPVSTFPVLTPAGSASSYPVSTPGTPVPTPSYVPGAKAGAQNLSTHGEQGRTSAGTHASTSSDGHWHCGNCHALNAIPMTSIHAGAPASAPATSVPITGAPRPVVQTPQRMAAAAAAAPAPVSAPPPKPTVFQATRAAAPGVSAQMYMN